MKPSQNFGDKSPLTIQPRSDPSELNNYSHSSNDVAGENDYLPFHERIEIVEIVPLI